MHIWLQLNCLINYCYTAVCWSLKWQHIRAKQATYIAVLGFVYVSPGVLSCISWAFLFFSNCFLGLSWCVWPCNLVFFLNTSAQRLQTSWMKSEHMPCVGASPHTSTSADRILWQWNISLCCSGSFYCFLSISFIFLLISCISIHFILFFSCFVHSPFYFFEFLHNSTFKTTHYSDLISSVVSLV